MKLSIITAVHNGLEVNKLYLKYLQKNNYYPFELIVVDNSSVDGSKEYFKENGAIVVETGGNLCYPCAQNAGIPKATGEYLAFLNNDLMVGYHWDKYLIEAMQKYGLDVASPSGIDESEDPRTTGMLQQRWEQLYFPYRKTTLTAEKLERMVEEFYDGFERFCRERADEKKEIMSEGINGPAVVMSKKAMLIIKKWNEYVLDPDWHLGLFLKKRQMEKGDLLASRIIASSWVHHFRKVTTANVTRQCTCAHKSYPLRLVWKPSEEKKFWKDGHFVENYLGRSIKRIIHHQKLSAAEKKLLECFKENYNC